MPTSPPTHRPFAKPAPTRARSSTERGYTYRWQIARGRYLRSHSLCARCLAGGRVTVATDVDHIMPHRNNPVLFWDQANWQALCHSCHSRKTQVEDRRRGV